jgi:hypothetical protein
MGDQTFEKPLLTQGTQKYADPIYVLRTGFDSGTPAFEWSFSIAFGNPWLASEPLCQSAPWHDA